MWEVVESRAYILLPKCMICVREHGRTWHSYMEEIRILESGCDDHDR